MEAAEKEHRDNCRAGWLQNPNEAFGFHTRVPEPAVEFSSFGAAAAL
jgi:hypothetical protein